LLYLNWNFTLAGITEIPSPPVEQYRSLCGFQDSAECTGVDTNVRKWWRIVERCGATMGGGLEVIVLSFLQA